LCLFELLNLQLYSTCDTTNNCFKDPINCKGDSDCIFIYQWTDNGDSNDFTLAAKIKTFTNRYAAIGFSKNAQMVNDRASSLCFSKKA
jgi:hypothetical protein